VKHLGMLLFVLMPGLARAERPLTYDEVVRLAAERSPGVRQAAAVAEQAEADVRAARGFFDPAFTLGGGWDRGLSRQRFGQFPEPFNLTSDAWNLDLGLQASAPTGTSASFDASVRASTVVVDASGAGGIVGDLFGNGQTQRNYQPSFRLTLSQELLRGIRLAFNLRNVRRAASSLTAAELEQERASQQAIADAAKAYWSWFHLAKVAQNSSRSVVVAEENLRVGTAKVAAGQAAPLEATRLEAALVQARTTALEAENSAAQAADALLLLLGEAPGQSLSPASELGDAPAVQLDPTTAVEDALAGSPEILVARERLRQARLGLADSRHAMWPSLTASVTGGLQGFDDTSLGAAFTLNETMFPSIGIAGTLRVPLGNRAAAGAAQRAAAEVQLLQDALAALEGQTRAAVEQQVRLLASAARRVELTDTNVRLARETLAAEEALHAVGRTLLKDVLEARTQVERAEAEAIRARTDFRAAEVELRRLQGRL